MITIYINDKEYKVKEAKTEEEKKKGYDTRKQNNMVRQERPVRYGVAPI